MAGNGFGRGGRGVGGGKGLAVGRLQGAPGYKRDDLEARGVPVGNADAPKPPGLAKAPGLRRAPGLAKKPVPGVPPGQVRRPTPKPKTGGPSDNGAGRPRFGAGKGAGGGSQGKSKRFGPSRPAPPGIQLKRDRGLLPEAPQAPKGSGASMGTSGSGSTAGTPGGGRIPGLSRADFESFKARAMDRAKPHLPKLREVLEAVKKRQAGKRPHLGRGQGRGLHKGRDRVREGVRRKLDMTRE